MKSKKEYTLGSGNIYEDLGLPNYQDLLIKGLIVSEISAIIQERELTQTEAAKILGISQPKISDLTRGHFEGYTIDRLFKFLNKLNVQVEVTFHRMQAA